MEKIAIQFLFIFVVAMTSSASHLSYDAFPPSDGPYVSGPASAELSWSGEDFESYHNGATLECSSNKQAASHIDVTSGCLVSKYAGEWRRGWTADSVFRAVAIGRDSTGREIKWTNQTNEFRAYIDSWHNNGNIPDWSGIHAFARYRTSDDLYVASIRYDGLVTIKRKWNGDYTTLAQATLNNELGEYLDHNGKLATRRWYRVKFSAIGNELKLYLDNRLLLTASSGTFSWGTTGIRIDNASTYLDDWKLPY